MTSNSNKELIKHYDEPEQVLHSLRKLFKTTSFDHSSSPEFELFSDHERQFEEEITKIITEPTMKEYMMRTREEYGSGVARPKFDKDARFELKGQFLKVLCEHTFRGSENEDANEHIETVFEIFDLFTTPDVTQDQPMLCVFPITLIRATTQLNNLSSGINKVNEKVYAAQVGCDLYNGPHYSKDCPLKEEGKTLEEAYYTQFGVPFPQAGRYRAAAPGFCQKDNGNASYQERRQTMEKSLN
ncbi:hypothetical protein Tco_1127428 [Tanacetum coccineum]